jgi:hypothetical protein
MVVDQPSWQYCVMRGNGPVGIMLPTALALLIGTSVLGQSTKIWLPAGSASWFVDSNWSPLGVPDASSISQINNGGTANADTGTSDVVSNRIEVGKNDGTGALNVVGRILTLGSDFDVGQIGSTYAIGSITVNSNGTATISNSFGVHVGTLGTGNIDVGSTGAGSDATANGVGSLTINTTTFVDVAEDINVGQSSAATNATATGNATLSMSSVGTFTIGGNLDVGKSGGSGRTSATGTATINGVTNSFTIGNSLTVGRTSGSTGAAGNFGHGTVSISDATLNVGFANAVAPGSVAVGDVIAIGSERGNAIGQATLQRVTLDVKKRISIGELSGGSTNAASTTDGTLMLVDSSITTPELDIATVVSGTAGTAKGKLSLDPTLVNVSGPMTLGTGSELVFALAGTTRATGMSGSGQYSALNADTAVLDGKLTIQLAGGFTPSMGNQFQVISTATSATGTFASIVLPTLPSGLGWGITSNSSGVLLTVGSGALPGDFNGDGKVDAADYVVWRESGGSATQYNSWRANYGRTAGSGASLLEATAVPEPVTIVLLLISILSALAHDGRWWSRPSCAAFE